jgi:hypothetical protein
VYGDDLTLAEALFEWTSSATPITWGNEEFLKQIQSGYKDDKLFTLILDKPTKYTGFAIKNDLIWQNNQHSDEVVCIPRNWDTITQIVDQAHTMLGHFGAQQTNEYIRQWYWWPLMNKDVREYCRTCESCQRVKGSNAKPLGKLHPLPVSVKPWDSIGMDFIGLFPESKGFNYLWSDDQYGSPNPSAYQDKGVLIIMDILTRDRMFTWASKFNCKQQGLKVHLEVVTWTPQNPRNKTVDVHVVSPSNWWSNQMHQP